MHVASDACLVGNTYVFSFYFTSAVEVYIFTEREHLALLGFIKLYPQGIVFFFQLHCNGSALTLPGHWFHCHQHHCQLQLNLSGSVVDYCVWVCLCFTQYYYLAVLQKYSPQLSPTSLYSSVYPSFTVAAVPWTAQSQSSVCG